MKTLLILRHAKSSWKDSGMDDFDRPLNKRGKADAPRVGEWLLEEKIIPDRILCSEAKRARSTAKGLIETSGFDGEITYHKDLYLAAPQVYHRHLKELPDSVACAMLIGHNPGLEELVEKLSGQFTVLPTAALAVLELPIQNWQDTELDGSANLLRLWLPPSHDFAS